jgi:hypothetical protein
VFVSPGTRLVADDSKATKRPSPLSAGPVLAPFPGLPLLSTLTTCVLPLARSRTKTSMAPLSSPGARVRRRRVEGHDEPVRAYRGRAGAPADAVALLAVAAHARRAL